MVLLGWVSVSGSDSGVVRPELEDLGCIGDEVEVEWLMGANDIFPSSQDLSGAKKGSWEASEGVYVY